MSVPNRLNGMFINESLNSINVFFLIYTGAKPTVISRNVLTCSSKSVRSKFYDNISKVPNSKQLMEQTSQLMDPFCVNSLLKEELLLKPYTLPIFLIVQY